MGCEIIGQEVQFAFGKVPQADIGTGNLAAGLWAWRTRNVTPAVVKYAKETDAAETGGKTHEWATQQYKVAKSFEFEIEMTLSSEILAWAGFFSLGATVKAGVGPMVYTSTPADRVVDGCELPYFSFLQKWRSEDHLFVGCVLAGFAINLQSGPGRTNSTITLRLIGSGRETIPAGVVFPASVVTPNEMLSASLGLTANGINYVTTKRINSISLEWNNAALTKYRPGSGQEDGYAVVGDIKYTPARTLGVSMDVDFANLNDEVAKVRNLAEGAAVVTLQNSANEQTQIDLHRIGYEDAEFSDTESGINLQVPYTMLYDSVKGLWTIATTTATDGIGGL